MVKPSKFVSQATLVTALFATDQATDFPKIEAGQIGNVRTEHEHVFLPSVTSAAVTQEVRPFSDQHEVWTKKLERRFNRLAEKFAFQTLSEDEAEELSELQRSRLVLKVPFSAEEVLAAHDRHMAVVALSEALQRYVRTIRPPAAARAET